ncbi:MAG: S1 RNA-binding domain-containing protein, partial [Candidatus Sulfotelmatobacter sp.]
MASHETTTEQRLSDPNATAVARDPQEEHQAEASPALTSPLGEMPHGAGAHEDKHAGEDFASALENFTTETEEAVGEDRVIKGTVLKLTPTHVVVDVGAKSEGMLPLSEVLDHEGKPKVKPGDEIDVMREKGHTEEGYVNLSHQKAARIHAWDEVEKAHNEKRPIQATVIERTKGGLTVDILGARAFLPGSQVDLRPIRNLEGMKGQTLEVTVIKLNKKRGNIVVSRKELLEG